MHYQGIQAQARTFYFEPDEEAPYGRYYDGVAISEHPSDSEINAHTEFWIALAEKEQKEVLQAMYDVQCAEMFKKKVGNKDAMTIVVSAIKFWDEMYPQEVKEFLAYCQEKRSTLANSGGWDRTKEWKFKGSIPQRVKHFVSYVKPELVKKTASGTSVFEKIFWSEFKKAIIGG